MNQKENWLENKLLPIAAKLSTNIYLTALRDGVTLAMPLIITGSLLMIIASFPIPAFTSFLESTGVISYLWKGVDCSFGLMGLIASFGVANSIANAKNTDGISAGVISLSSFLTLTPFHISDSGNGLPVVYMGSRGLFVAIVVGLISASVYSWFVHKNIVIKMPDSVPPAVSRSFSALIPGCVIIVSSLIIYTILDLLKLPNIHDIVISILGGPLGLLGSNLFGTIIVVALNSLFWFVGVHGGHTVGSVMNPIYLMNTDANRLAFQAGEELPNIITSPFMDNFVWMGGGGATIGLVICIAIVAKRKHASKMTKTLAPLTLTPGIFNINEPALFGVPIVMNLSLLVPFTIAPMANAIVSYFAMASGLVAKTNGAAIPWTTPPVIGGFLATGDWKASVLQILLIIMDIFIYYGFYLAVERQNKALETSDK